MTTKPIVLILGGTFEARALAKAVAVAEIDAIYSYAGRTASPERLPIPTRIGGYGGAEGMTEYLGQTGITHVVDATHPFAQNISRNAAIACTSTGTPLIALTRPEWQPEAQDQWLDVPDMQSAVAALDVDTQRVFLAIGKQEVDLFAARPQHHYLLRFVDAPETPPPLPNRQLLLGRGPFTVEGDLAMMRDHGTTLVVSKNSGGSGARAKLDAARSLGLPVVMVSRPKLPDRLTVGTPQEVIDWIVHSGTMRGV